MENSELNQFINDFDIKLLAAPTPSDAAKIKFEKGRAEHGEIFLKDPKVEIYQELLDAMNYCDVAISRGDNTMKNFKDILEALALDIRADLYQSGFEDHQGKCYPWDDIVNAKW